MKAIVLIVLSVAVFGAARGQDATTLRDRLTAVNQQIQAAQTKIMQSPDYAALRKTASDAQAALNKAIGDIPEIAQIDKQTSDLRTQMGALQQSRRKAIESHGKDLADVQSAATNATAAVMSAVMDSPEVKPLMLERTALLRQLAEAQRSTNSVVVRNGPQK